MKSDEKKGFGCLAPLSMLFILIVISVLFDKVTFYIAAGFYFVVMLLTFAVFNAVFESWLKQYDPLRDVFFFAFSLAFTALGIFMAMKYYDPMNVYIGVLLGLIGGVLAFIYRPQKIKKRLFEIPNEKIKELVYHEEKRKEEILTTPLYMDKEKLNDHFSKKKWLWMRIKSPVFIGLIYRPYYLVKVSVTAKKGIGKYQKLGIGNYDIDVLANAHNGGLYGVDDDLQLRKKTVNKSSVIEPVYELSKIEERAGKFARTSVGPSKYRTVPTVLSTKGKLIYRPHWLVLFSDDDYIIIPADNQKLVERR